MTMNDSRFLSSTLDAQMLKTTSNLQLLTTAKLTNVDESTTKLAGMGSAWGTGPAVLNRRSVLEILYFSSVFYDSKMVEN